MAGDDWRARLAAEQREKRLARMTPAEREVALAAEQRERRTTATGGIGVVIVGLIAVVAAGTCVSRLLGGGDGRTAERIVAVSPTTTTASSPVDLDCRTADAALVRAIRDASSTPGSLAIGGFELAAESARMAGREAHFVGLQVGSEVGLWATNEPYGDVARLIWAVDPTARRVTDLGIDVSADQLPDAADPSARIVLACAEAYG